MTKAAEPGVEQLTSARDGQAQVISPTSPMSNVLVITEIETAESLHAPTFDFLQAEVLFKLRPYGGVDKIRSHAPLAQCHG
jgi:hypothetical protein